MIGIARFEREHRVDPFDDLARRDDLVVAPLPLRVERHELDEPHPDALFATEAREVDDLVVVDAAHHDRVHLHGVQSGDERGVDAGEHPVELVALGERKEALSPERIERHVDAAQSRRREIVRELGEPHTVRRHRDVDAQGREQLHQPGHVRAHQRLTAGDPDGLEPIALDAHPCDPGDLLVGQQLLPRQPLHPLFGHAVGAAEVAAIGDRDPEILDAARERIDQRNRHPRVFTASG